MNREQSWKQEDIKTLVEMWRNGDSIADIANKLNKKRSAVAQYAHRNRAKLGLGHRQIVVRAKRKQKQPFEQQWSGSVPFGHWTITKAWSKK